MLLFQTGCNPWLSSIRRKIDFLAIPKRMFVHGFFCFTLLCGGSSVNICSRYAIYFAILPGKWPATPVSISASSTQQRGKNALASVADSVAIMKKDIRSLQLHEVKVSEMGPIEKVPPRPKTAAHKFFLHKTRKIKHCSQSQQLDILTNNKKHTPHKKT